MGNRTPENSPTDYEIHRRFKIGVLMEVVRPAAEMDNQRIQKQQRQEAP